jgi:hypothetical protein
MKNFMSGLAAELLKLHGEMLSSSLLWQDGERQLVWIVSLGRKLILRAWILTQ